MKKIIMFLLICFMSFGFAEDVFALSGKLTVTSNVSSAATNTKFNVYVKYSGDTVGTIRINTAFTNATCTLYSQADGFTRNCTTSGCKIKFEDYEKGYKSGTTLATFACTGTASPAKFTANVIDGDAWDLEGLSNVSVASGSLNIPITNATTTTKKTTTKSTTKKTTTTTKKTTTKSTTKGTTKGTTKSTTTTKGTTTTRRPTVNTTTTSRTTISTTKSNVVIINPTVHTTTSKVVTTSINHLPDDMKLKELKIVGYDINFNRNNTGYKIKLAKDVSEVYVIATPIDHKNEVENTGVVNVEGLQSFKIRVYNEEFDEEVIYNIEIEREKTSVFQDLYNKVFKPTIAVAIILFTLLLLGIYFYNRPLVKMEKYNDNKDDDDDEDEEVEYKGGHFVVDNDDDEPRERMSFLTSPNTEVVTDVPIKTIQAKNASINRKKKEELEKKLNEVGIEEIPENEQELTRVLIQLNKTNADPNMETISEKVQNKKIKISKVEKPSSLSHTTTRVRFRVDENYDEDLISNEVKMRISNVDKVKLTDNDEEEDD